MQTVGRTFVLTEKDMDRLSVIRCVMEKKLAWKEAAERLGLSWRQVARLVARVRREGNTGILHRLRGRPSNHQLPEGSLEKALRLVKVHYPDFGPTFATEKLATHGVELSRETLRRAMIKAGFWQSRKKKAFHRAWRQRRACLGELIQLDGSHHDWLEGRGPKCVLISFVDDATGRILYAGFTSAEDTISLMRLAKAYISACGRPLAFYADKHAVYKVNKQHTVEAFLRDPQPMTQFTRALSELGIEMIWANSPQAKGRIERSFETLQDRLVKEMRLLGISDIQEANRFLHRTFLPDYNRRFGKMPANPQDAHRPLLVSHRLEDIFCLKTHRTVMNDFTVRFKDKLFQIAKRQVVSVKPKDKIIVRVSLQGTVGLWFRGIKLRAETIQTPIRCIPSVHREFQPLRFLVPKTKYRDLIPQISSPWHVSCKFFELKTKWEEEQKTLDKPDVSILVNA